MRSALYHCNIAANNEGSDKRRPGKQTQGLHAQVATDLDLLESTGNPETPHDVALPDRPKSKNSYNTRYTLFLRNTAAAYVNE